MTIMKFGGTSVGSGENMKRVTLIVNRARALAEQVVVVCSAMGGVTDELIALTRVAEQGDSSYRAGLARLVERHRSCARELIDGHALIDTLTKVDETLGNLSDVLNGITLLKECTPRSRDLIMSFGERLSTFLICETLRATEPSVVMLDTRFIVKTDERFGNARVLMQETLENIQAHVGEHPLCVATGFIGSTVKGETTTLGRGGSDYTASLFGAALGADEIQIWTDVDGVLTADPRLVQGTQVIEQMSYEEAMELSHFGAKVIYPPTMQPARELGIPIVIKNTFNPEHPGTRIVAQTKPDGPVKGISSIKQVALLRVSGSGMVGVTGIAGRLFQSLASAGVNIMMITQGSSEYSICVVLNPDDCEQAVDAIKQEFALELLQHKIDEVDVARDLSIIAVVGDRMRHVPGVGGKIFTALGDYGVNVVAIAQGSSERNISIVVDEDQAARGMQAIHDRFFTQKRAPLQVVLVGTGLVGTELMKQMTSRQADSPLTTLCGVMNSRQMLMSADGVDMRELEDDGEPADLSRMVDWLKKAQLPHAVFVDCTASEEPVRFYEELLHAGVSVVTPNKRATSGGLESYKRLKQAGRDSFFRYETNVGAGLPVIGVMQSLIGSGDQIHLIEGTLSGTLSYLFNTYREGMSFTSLVREAREKGFTEPDPRDDLSGMDVARKLLILAREMGLELELDDVEVENLVPEDCRNVQGVDAFFDALKVHDQSFADRLAQARAQGRVLRYVARVEAGQARVRLEAVDETHPCFSLSGSDNLISFTTNRYHDRPLVVRGPGAGAQVTAAGVLADILSCSP